MTARSKPKTDRLHSAAVVKVKYMLTAGRLDEGFQLVYQGVLKDLELQENEVDQYIESHRDELTRLCVDET